MNDYATKAEIEQLRADIRELRAASLHRWEFWVAILAVMLSMFFGTWSASQTAAQNGLTVAQAMDEAADEAAERATERIVRELTRNDQQPAEK